jgi:hypothetical protein
MGVLASFLASQPADEKLQRQSESSDGQSESSNPLLLLPTKNSNVSATFPLLNPESSGSSGNSRALLTENDAPIKHMVKDKVYLIDISTGEDASVLPRPVENENQASPAATPAIPATLAVRPTQRDADRRIAAALRERSTDRWCSCGQLATFAWPDASGRDVWLCLDCVPVRGKA